MNSRFWSGRWVLVGVVIIGAMALTGKAQEGASESSSAASSASAKNEAGGSTNSNATTPGRQEMNQSGTHSNSPIVGEILKMLDAGVSREVIQAYVETTAITSEPTPADLIALKEHSVGDNITLALLKRSAQVRQQSSPAARRVATTTVQAANTSPRSYLDPESYEYFQYYYLYPRTLAHARARLGLYPWSTPWGYYPGYYAPGFYSPGPGHFGFGGGYVR